MRCISKCVVGRSLRVYSVLLFGMAVGFSLSTLLQTVSYTGVSRTAERLKEAVDYRFPGGKATFSNLDGKASEAEQQIDIGGYYDYERLALRGEEAEVGDGGKEEKAKVAVGEEGYEPVKDLKMKQREYLSETWQGRNVRETSDNAPVVKLSDELAPRNTLLIGVITRVSQLMSQTLAIQGTWGMEASQVVYFTGEVESLPHLPHGMVVVQLEGLDDLQASWEMKEIAAINYISNTYLESTDWFLIVGDETYVSSAALERHLNRFDASTAVYMGRPLEVKEEAVEGEEGKEGEGKGEGQKTTDKLCNSESGVVYSRGFFEKLKPYLPVCWPGHGGEREGLSGCISIMGLKCTAARETKDLFVSEAKSIIESPNLFKNTHLQQALVIHQVKYAKYIYRLHSYFKELEYNASLARAKDLANIIKDTHPFVPSHLRSPFTPTKSPPIATPSETTPTPPPATKATTAPTQDSGVVIRPRHIPKNKFEINYWEYFNQTRLMSVMHESPARGIIGGTREEARFALTKAIYLANQGRPQNERYVFDKLENGYHRVDPMRGSEYILDFVFRKSSDHSVRLKKRVSILRPFHETVVPVDAQEVLPTVNFITVLSGLSNRLETFLANYEKTVLQTGEDATLTVVLFDGPDASKVRSMLQQYMLRYQAAKITIVDTQGEFARGIGLHKGVERFKEDDLLFLVDVDLDISTNFLQRCRLNTIHGKQVYFPIFFKLYNPEFVSQYHRGNSSMRIARHAGHWAHYSYGMVCIFASDYHKAGGFDRSMRGWGEEDVDFMGRALGKGLEIFRAPDPGLIHNWHRKVCDKSTVINPVAYDHCLMSKGENLADRIELAQYVFDNELKKGNLL